MTAVLEQTTVAGVYDIPAEAYHADPVPGGSLSSSGARVLLDCPARFRYRQQNPEPFTKTFDVGHAAHKVVLGAGPELVRIDADEWRTKAVKEEVAAVRARGAVPLKPADWARVHAMADALRTNRWAASALSPDSGLPERTLVWRDDETDVWCRAMVDWLRHTAIVDYKSTISVATDAIARTVATYGYHQQDAWYLDGAAALDLDVEMFLFVFQEKDPPYFTRVVELDQDDLLRGRARNRRALALYRDCTVAGVWPAYPDEITTITLPRWATYAEEAPLE